MSSEIWNLSTLCRCCHADGYFTSLNLAHQAKDGVEYVYEIMLRDTLGITISPPPLDASYAICNMCIDKLIDASNFKKQVLMCEEKFTVYCTNEQFMNASDAVKVEVDKDDDDHNSEDSLPPVTDIKEEFTIEVDIKHPINEFKEEKRECTETKTEIPKSKKNTKQQKNSKISTPGAHYGTLRLDRSVVVPVNTDNGLQYSCKNCGGLYQTIKTMNIHLCKYHSAPYKCELCSKQLKNRSSYLRHVKSHSKERFKCPYCQKKFISKDMFKNHVNTHTKEQKFICDLCEKEFKYKQTLKKHLQRHAGTLRKLLCDLCGNSFNDRTNLNIHINSVHEKLRPFTCSICGRTYSTKNHLRKHCKAFHQGKKGQNHCDICDINISCPKTYKIHMMRHDNKFMCRYCKEVFNEKVLCSQHIQAMHAGNNPCHLCPKTFYSKHSLNRHIDSHNGIKRFGCEVCGKKFNQKVMLKRHTFRFHNPENSNRNYELKTKCEVCKKSFKNIISHMDSHTNRKHACEICGKTYPKTNALNRHKELKHFGKSFDCDICNKKYLQKAKLNTHKIKVHQIKIEKVSPNGS